MRWDVFCRVVDNHGDIGVCWRLACDLASRGERVRLWVDDASSLRWMAPEGAPGVELQPWREPLPGEAPGDVVIEAFGCEPPACFVAAMAGAEAPPVWINLEYLSAESYVERSHGLPSPQQSGPGRGLTKWFFYPGFTERTGGLLREAGLASAQQRFEPHAWRINAWPSGAPQDTPVFSLFCYDNPALAGWLEQLRQAATPAKLFVTPGPAARQAMAWLGREVEAGKSVEAGALWLHFLPWLTQRQYDELLWSCDLNFVRGEDSLVRALWAAQPFVWQLYPQDDGAHLAKLEAFLQQYASRSPSSGLPRGLAATFEAWNRGTTLKLPAVGAMSEWGLHATEASRRLRGMTDLTTQLCRFVAEKR